MTDELAILGLGVALPPAVEVPELARAHGADTSAYRGWARACQAGPDDHPSTLGEQALRAALESCLVEPSDLDLVVYCGTSRDYPASWSVSTEIIHRCGVGPEAVGIDLMAGCLATLAAVDFAQGWLAMHGGGHAAVVAAERWTQTVDYTDTSAMGLWAYGDGAGALVVGIGSDRPPLAGYVGSAYRNASENNGHVRIRYGGTREPVAPPGVNPHLRILGDRPRDEIIACYRAGYHDAAAAVRERFGLSPTHLVCNQLTPGMVAMVADACGLPERVTITGHRTGHLGGPDLVVGLQEHLGAAEPGDTILLSASAAYAFGAALVTIAAAGKLP